MKKFISEFKEFISRGNVIDLAVGIIIGSAFTAIVNSLVNQVVMPPIGYILGRVDFSDLKFPLKAATADDPGVYISWGSFVQQCVNFLIIAFVVFCMVKLINRLKRTKVEEIVETKPVEPELSAELKMLTEIRDLLKDSRK